MSKEKTVSSQNSCDVLIVCGQGTYEDGMFYTEYPDRDVYFRHAITVTEIVSQYRYTHIVCSGGYTQRMTPSLSEARSFLNVWADTDSKPDIKKSFFLDEISLDSAENVYLSLMAARKELKPIERIRRIGLFAAWKFKKDRFTALARELGIEQRFYFHGLANADEAIAGAQALQGELDQMRSIRSSNDHLLLSEKWENKRLNRYSKPDPPKYEGRLLTLRNRFGMVFEIIDRIRDNGATQELREEFQTTFLKEIIKPGNRN
jgi:hypothetical protein